MTIESNTSKALRFSVLTAMAVIAVGLVLFIPGITDSVLRAGVLILILSPFIGVCVSTVSLYLEKDMRWLAVALVLIAVSAVGALIG